MSNEEKVFLRLRLTGIYRLMEKHFQRLINKGFYSLFFLQFIDIKRKS